MSYQAPEGLAPEDEFRHAGRPGAERVLFGDTLWVSVVDPAAGSHGVNHFHLSNHGYARFEALYVIDGVVQLYGNKIPLDVKPDRGPWSDGRMRYEVVEPFNHIRISLDWEKVAFDLGFKGRVAVYEVMVLSETLKEFVLNGASSTEIKREAIRGGMSTLRRSSLNKVLEGGTTLSEVFRVSARDD